MIASVALVVRVLWAIPLLSPPSPAGPSDRPADSVAPAEACSVQIVGRDTLRVDGHPVYMEPLVFDRGEDGEILLAGRFTHVFDQDEEGVWIPLEQDSVFGVVLSPGGAARAVVSPVPAHLVDDVRAAARPQGGWDVVFTELPDSAREEHPRAIRLWHGVLNGNEWKAVQQIPLPVGHEVGKDTHGELVRTSAGLAWAAVVKPADRPYTIMVFRQEGGRWTHDSLPIRSASYAALAAPDSTRLVLAIAGPDPNLNRDGNSLSLWVRDPEWRMARKVVPSSIEEVHSPMLHASGELVLGWEGVPQDPLSRGRRLLRVLRAPLTNERGEPVTVDSANLTSTPPRPVLENRRGRLWVTMHSGGAQGPELRFVQSLARGASVIGGMPYPFDTPTIGAAAISPSEVLVVGGDYDPELRMIWMPILSARVACGDPSG